MNHLFLLACNMNLVRFKNCRVCKLIICSLLFLIFSGSSYSQNLEFTEQEQEWIKNHPVIKFGYEPQWAPFEIYEEGEYKGIIGDYVKILEREIGIKIQPIPNITWEETIHGLKSGEVDFTVCAGISEDRKKYLNFTEPYITSPMVIVTRNSSSFIKGLEDLQGKTISLPKGYYQAEIISRDYPKINIDYKNGVEEAINAVSMGESEAFVGNLVVVSYYIEHMGYSNLKIAAPTDYEKSYIALGARKDWPELISISQKVFDNISFEERNEILQKWMNVRYEYGVSITKIKTFVIYGLLCVILLFIIIMVWNKSLKRQIEKRKLIERELESALVDVNQQNEERKVLLQEVHHRVKNNLQIIVSLLRLQRGDADKNLEIKLNETINRINAISLIHEKVYLTENVASIDLEHYIHSLAREIITSFSYEKQPKLEVSSNLGDVDLKPLIPVALILNELITNTLKYAVNSEDEGLIKISVNREGDVIKMMYSDNGAWKETTKEKSLGQTLINIFTDQLDGTYELKTKNGTTYNFEFKDF